LEKHQFAAVLSDAALPKCCVTQSVFFPLHTSGCDLHHDDHDGSTDMVSSQDASIAAHCIWGYTKRLCIRHKKAVKREE